MVFIRWSSSEALQLRTRGQNPNLRQRGLGRIDNDKSAEQAEPGGHALYLLGAAIGVLDKAPGADSEMVGCSLPTHSPGRTSISTSFDIICTILHPFSSFFLYRII